MPVYSFPLPLDGSEPFYAVMASLDNDCGNQILRDTFRVDQPVPFTIQFPPQDTAICVGSTPVPLRLNGTTEASGTWLVNGIAFSPLFIPENTGDFNIEFVRGSGACETRDARKITVQGVNIEANDVTICEGSAAFPLSATPAGGNYNSPDCPECVTAQGFFDPSKMGDKLSVTVNYALQNSIGCNASKAIQVMISQPAASFSIDNSTCAGRVVDADFSGSTAESLT